MVGGPASVRFPTSARVFLFEWACYRPFLTLRRVPVSVKQRVLEKGRPDPRVVIIDCYSHSCYVVSSEGLNHLRMQFKGLEGVFHVRELGLVWSLAALCPRTGPRFETAGGSRGPHRALGGTVGRAADRRNHGRRPTSIRRGSTRVKRTVCRPLRRPVVQPRHVRGIIDPLTIRIEDLAEMDRSSRTYRLAEDVLLGRDVDCATHIGAWRNKELEPFL